MQRVIAFLYLVSSIHFAIAGPQEDRAAWVGNALYRISEHDRWEYLYFLEQIAYFKSKPELLKGGGDWIRKWALQEKLASDQDASNFTVRNGSGVPAIDRANLVYSALQEEGMAGHLVGHFLKNALAQHSNDLVLNAYLDKSKGDVKVHRARTENARGVLEAVYDLARDNTAVREAVDEVYGRFLNAFLNESAPQILSKNADIQNNKYLADLLTGQTLTAARVDEIRNLILQDAKSRVAALEEYKNQIAGQLQWQRKLLLDQNQLVIKMLERAQEAAAAEQKAYVDKQRDDALRAGAFIISSLMGDRKSARQFSTTINAIADIRAAYREYEQSLRLLRNSDDSSGMSSLIFTANIVSAILKITDAFSTTGPTSDQVILEALGKLSEQVANLHKEMRGRFDQIDRNLIIIYEEILSGFRKMEFLVRQIEMDVQANRQALERIHLQLEIAESRLSVGIEFLIEQSFKERMISCLGYEAVHGKRLNRDQYSACVDSIRAYISTGKDVALSGYWLPEFDDPSKFAAVTEGQSEQSYINLYLGMAQSMGAYPNFERVPSIPRWSLASKAYSALVLENHDHFVAAPTKALEEIIADGKNIYRYQASVLTKENPESFWKTIKYLIGKYRRSLKRVEEAAAVERYKSLKRQNVKIGDVGSCPINQIDEELLNAYRARSIRHINSNDEGYIEPAGVWRIPGTAFTGDSNWPVINNARPVWNALLTSVPNLLDWDALGLGEISVGYQVIWSNPTLYDGAGAPGPIVFANPIINYNIYLQPPNEGKRRLAGSFTESLGIEGIAYTELTRGSVWASLRINRPTDLIAYLSKPDFETTNRAAIKTPLATTVAPQLAKRGVSVIAQVKNDLMQEAMSRTSNLGIALEEVDGTVLMLRRFIGLAFPNYLRESEKLREILYGRPSWIALGDSTTLPTLLSRNGVLDLIANVDMILADVAKASPENQLSRLCLASELKDVFFLRAISRHGEFPLSSLIEELQSAFAKAKERPDHLPEINAELGNLQLLHHIYSVSRLPVQ